VNVTGKNVSAARFFFTRRAANGVFQTTPYDCKLLIFEEDALIFTYLTTGP
jgi:hypothetical protein